MNKLAVIFTTPRERENLRRCKYAKKLKFVYLGTQESIYKSNFSISSFVRTTSKKLSNIEPKGILSTGDFDSILSSHLSEKFGLIFPNLESILSCQHKIASRKIQKSILPEITPTFRSIDILAQENLDLSYPFFIKPAFSSLSYFAKKIKNPNKFNIYLEDARKELPIFLEDFKELFNCIDSSLNKRFPISQAIVEELLSGKQVTVDGYVYEGEIRILGIVDSIKYPNKFSFKRFQYPSRIPEKIEEKMKKISKKIMKATGFNNSMFNIEFFYSKNEIRIIEINSRMATQFANLYQAVDGSNLYDIQIDLALGKEPEFEKGRGNFRIAASFVPRFFKDKKVLYIPSLNNRKSIKEKFPETIIDVMTSKNYKLSDVIQDGKSFRYILINTAAKNEQELSDKYQKITSMLPFKFKSL